jgi:hypothetical protein
MPPRNALGAPPVGILLGKPVPDGVVKEPVGVVGKLVGEPPGAPVVPPDPEPDPDPDPDVAPPLPPLEPPDPDPDEPAVPVGSDCEPPAVEDSVIGTKDVADAGGAPDPVDPPPVVLTWLSPPPLGTLPVSMPSQ